MVQEFKLTKIDVFLPQMTEYVSMWVIWYQLVRICIQPYTWLPLPSTSRWRLLGVFLTIKIVFPGDYAQTCHPL